MSGEPWVPLPTFWDFARHVHGKGKPLKLICRTFCSISSCRTFCPSRFRILWVLPTDHHYHTLHTLCLHIIQNYSEIKTYSWKHIAAWCPTPSHNIFTTFWFESLHVFPTAIMMYILHKMSKQQIFNVSLPL